VLISTEKNRDYPDKISERRRFISYDKCRNFVKTHEDFRKRRFCFPLYAWRDRACGSGNVIRPESPKKTPLDHWRVAIIRGATPVSPSQSRWSFMVERAGNGCREDGGRGRGRSSKTMRRRQIGLRARNKLAQLSPNSRGSTANVARLPGEPGEPPHFFPLGTSGTRRGGREEEQPEEEKRRASPGSLFLVSNTILTELEDGAAMASPLHVSIRLKRPLQTLRKVFTMLSLGKGCFLYIAFLGIKRDKTGNFNVYVTFNCTLIAGTWLSRIWIARANSWDYHEIARTIAAIRWRPALDGWEAQVSAGFR